MRLAVILEMVVLGVHTPQAAVVQVEQMETPAMLVVLVTTIRLDAATEEAEAVVVRQVIVAEQAETVERQGEEAAAEGQVREPGQTARVVMERVAKSESLAGR